MWNQLSTSGKVFLLQWLLKVHLHSFTVFACEYQVRVPSGSQVRVVRQVFTSALPFVQLSVKIRPKLRALERHMPIYGHIYMPAEIQHLHFIKLWCWEFGFPNPVRSMFPEGSRLLPLLLQSLSTAALLKSNASSKIALIIPRPASKYFLSTFVCNPWDASSSNSFLCRLFTNASPPLLQMSALGMERRHLRNLEK